MTLADETRQQKRRIARQRYKVADPVRWRTQRQDTKQRSRDKGYLQRPFLALDSEGKTGTGGKHELTLIACSNGEYIQNDNGICTKDIFAWLISLSKKNPEAIFVIYGGSYDFNMWLKSIDKDTLKRIWERSNQYPMWISCSNYAVQYVARKKLVIYDYEGYGRFYKRDDTGKLSYQYNERIVIYDVSPFWQCSFLTALEGMKKDLRLEDVKIIEKGKAARADFEAAGLGIEAVLEYTRAELRVLVTMMDTLRQGFYKDGLKLRDWFGPGAIATAILRLNKAPKTVNPPEIEDIAARAFFGGRIELVQYGHFGKITGLDINSAYPQAITGLPDLSEARWHRTLRIESPDIIGCYKVFWIVKDKAISFGPLPYRDHEGKVFFPRQGCGWYWSPEIHTALNTEYYHIQIMDGYWLESPYTYPYKWVEDLYYSRMEAKRAGDHGLQLARKLAMNSLYGKMAQTIGKRKGDKPGYTNFVLAGLITSICRARILYKALQDPGRVIAFCTDGIYFDGITPATHNIGMLLGDWSVTDYDRAIFVQAGVYWLEREGELEMKSRGIIKPKNPQDYLDSLYTAISSGELTVSFPTRNFITMGAALKSITPLQDIWCRWIDGIKKIDLTQYNTKRADIHYTGELKKLWQQRASIRTSPAACHDALMGIESAPYTGKWLDEDTGIDIDVEYDYE